MCTCSENVSFLFIPLGKVMGENVITFRRENVNIVVSMWRYDAKKKTLLGVWWNIFRN